MKLSLSRLLLLFLIGAVISPFGDHGHVVSGTTQYLSTAVPFVWDSALWFPLMVGLATAATAELRLHLGPLREDVDWRDGLAGIAVVMGIYAMTALLRHQPLVPATVLIVAFAVITWRCFGDGPGAICGLLAGIMGAGVEAAMVAAGLFRYAKDIDVLCGVAPWLPALYFAFGVVVAQLGEIAARTQKPQ